eukprot:maker-scaffold194_size270518-snap-gene-1.28 protein:Tk00343 transcript:maker-scaffold194_size270518-snap-gene-1.28-mRNA-1 annotation:"hypothetical protein CAPTEDRAFT_223034"
MASNEATGSEDTRRRDAIRPALAWGLEHRPYVLFHKENLTYEIAGIFNAVLRPYQRQGIQFLFNGVFGSSQPAGIILADDMGLGKTIQVIGLLSALLKKTHQKEVDWLRCHHIRMGQIKVDRAFLIISPASVMFNWAEELDKFGYFIVEKFHARDRDSILRLVKRGEVEILLTTFETARENINELNDVDWDAVIVDEVHKIKEPKARVTQALKGLRCRRRIGLTGTLLQNKYDELWCLLDWANPGCLGSLRSFSHKYSQNIEKGLKVDATKVELAKARELQKELDSFRTQFVLRRTKDKTIQDQLPKKTDQVVFCQPSKFQLSVFQALLLSEEMQFVYDGLESCPCGSGQYGRKCCRRALKGQEWNQVVFTWLHLFLKVANHVALLMPHRTTSTTQRLEAERFCQIAFAQDHPDMLDHSKFSRFQELANPKYSGKMQVLVKMLKAIENEPGNSKVLVFSYSTRVLDILEIFVQGQGYEYLRLDGTTPIGERAKMVANFNADPSIFTFLISTKAGGLGLNITSANVVIVFDPNWNPSHDLQAQDRAYRLGQTRDVRVFRLISAGTIEENIYLRQVYKQQLGRNAVDGEKATRFFRGVQGQVQGELFGVKNLFAVRFEGKYLIDTILERQDLVKDLAGGPNFQVKENVLQPRDEEIDEHEFLEDLLAEGTEQPRAAKSEMEVILESTQVVHRHANQDLVGGSRWEDQISKAAAKSVLEGNCDEEELAWENVEMGPTQDVSAQAQTQELVQPEAINLEPKRNFDQSLAEIQRRPRVFQEPGSTKVLYGQTPKTIQMRDFSHLAQFMDMSLQDCAERVLQLNSKERFALLGRFYASQNVANAKQVYNRVHTEIQERKECEKVRITKMAKTKKARQTTRDSDKMVIELAEDSCESLEAIILDDLQENDPPRISPMEDRDPDCKPAPKERYRSQRKCSESSSEGESALYSKVRTPPREVHSQSCHPTNDSYYSILNSPPKDSQYCTIRMVTPISEPTRAVALTLARVDGPPESDASLTSAERSDDMAVVE